MLGTVLRSGSDLILITNAISALDQTNQDAHPSIHPFFFEFIFLIDFRKKGRKGGRERDQ